MVGYGKRILIVDDEKDYAQLLAVFLQKLKVEIATARSGKEAMNVLTSSKTDLVLTDTNMKEGDGIWLIKRIKEVDPELPVIIFFTSYDQNPNINEQTLLAMGASYVIEKSPYFSEIVKKCESLLK